MFDWIASFLTTYGYVALAVLMFAENVFPPIPSELIMPLAGYLAASGRLDPVLCLVAGSAGSLAGATLWFWASRTLGAERLARFAASHGRWLTLHPDDVARVGRWFDRHGRAAVLVGRLMPTVRTLISVPAGLSRMSVPAFLAFSVVGTLIWTATLLGAGFLLEHQFTRVEALVDPVANAIFVVAAGLYLYRVATWKAPST